MKVSQGHDNSIFIAAVTYDVTLVPKHRMCLTAFIVVSKNPSSRQIVSSDKTGSDGRTVAVAATHSALLSIHVASYLLAPCLMDHFLNLLKKLARRLPRLSPAPASEPATDDVALLTA